MNSISSLIGGGGARSHFTIYGWYGMLSGVQGDPLGLVLLMLYYVAFFPLQVAVSGGYVFFLGYFVVNYPSCQRLFSWDAHCCCSCHSLKLSARLVHHSLLVEDCRLFLITTGAALCVVRTAHSAAPVIIRNRR